MKQQKFEQLYQAQWQLFQLLLDAKSIESQKKLLTSIKQKKAANTKSLASTNDLIATNHSTTTNNSIINSNLKNGDSNTGLTENDLHTAQTNQDAADANYQFVELYRLICQHYSLAKQRHYSPQLVNRLNDMVLAGHRQLYQRKAKSWRKLYDFFAYTFPIRVRAHATLFWISFACFTLPLLLTGIACYLNDEMLYSIMSASQVHNMESMYDPANRVIGRDAEHQADANVMMFGVYIQNNIGIDFQVYAMGIFAGIGTLFVTFYNGLIIGGVAGHLTNKGFGETFWSFVAGHGSFELTAVVISGAAGLKLAQSLFMPGNYVRRDAFKIAGKQSIELLIGAASMTFIAAFIEAFWSSSTMIPNIVKYIVALLLWALVIVYLLKAGRGYEYKVIDHAT